MSCLTAVVPDGEQPRADVVAARLARKVAPLFGVRWSGSPFGRTWVCDFASLTLAEVGRGAPYPAKAGQARTEVEATSGEGADEAWHWVGRGVWTPNRAATPTALPAATLNRFGPDTKSAVVLLAANRLLVDATSAVATVCRYLADRDVDPGLRLAVWAVLVLEVYRGQPALVVAALQARAVQRSLTARWGAQLGTGDTVSGESARSEFPLPDPDAEADVGASRRELHPTGLDLVDATLPLLDLQVARPGMGPVMLVGDRLDDIASAWCRRLLRLGRPGRGVVWLTESQGHRTVQAYVRVGAVVAPFVAEVLDGVHDPGDEPVPDLPLSTELTALPMFARRAQVVAVHAAVNYLRYRDELLQARPALRRHTRERAEEAAVVAVAVLGPGDPAAVLANGYAAYLDLWDRLRQPSGSTQDLSAAVQRVQACQRQTIAAQAGEALDPGAATYLLEITNVALASAGPVLGWPPELDRSLTKSWRACLTARGLAEEVVLGDPGRLHPAQAFHLHHYAAQLARRGGPVRLRRALALQTRVTQVRDEVAALEPVGYPAKHTASRLAHELAASIAQDLAEALPPREQSARAVAREEALRHAAAVLDNPSTPALLRSGEPAAAVLAAARSALPPVAAALQVDGGADLLTPAQAERARTLLAAAGWSSPPAAGRTGARGPS